MGKIKVGGRMEKVRGVKRIERVKGVKEANGDIK